MTSYHFNSAIFYHNLKYQAAVVDLKDFNLDCLKRGVEVRKIGQGQIIKSLELRPQTQLGSSDYERIANTGKYFVVLFSRKISKRLPNFVTPPSPRLVLNYLFHHNVMFTLRRE